MKITLNKENYKGIIYEYVCLLLIYFSFIKYTGRFGGIPSLICLAASAILWAHYFIKNNIGKKEFTIVAVICIYSCLLSLVGNDSLVMVVSYLPAALYLMHKEDLKSLFWNIIPLMIVVDLLIAWSNSPNNYILYTNISRNYISVFVLYSLAFYIIKCDKKDKICNLIWIVIAWAISISAIGRGGIISTSFIFVLFLMQWVFGKECKNALFRYAKITLFVVAMIILLIWVGKNLDYVQMKYFGRFFGSESSSVNTSNYERTLIITEYFNRTFSSVGAFLFGADAHIMSAKIDNLHNSYLQMHNKLGIFGIAFLTMGIIKSSIYFLKEKRWQMLFIFGGLLLRGMTDWCFPTFPIDMLMFYFLLTPYIEKKAEKKV